MSRATRDAAAAAEIRFADYAYAIPGASAFALRNADRVRSLGTFEAPDFATIQPYSQLRDLEIELASVSANVALLPCSLTKLEVDLCFWSIDWDNFRQLRCLQELQISNFRGSTSGFSVQLDDSFATALPRLRVFHVSPGRYNVPYAALETTARLVMPHLVEFNISHMNTVHLDLHFMSAQTPEPA